MGTDLTLGFLFLTAGLIMKHACENQTDEVCTNIYDDGQILMITGSVILGIWFGMVLIAAIWFRRNFSELKNDYY